MIQRRNFIKAGALAAGGLVFSRQRVQAAETMKAFSLPELNFSYGDLEPHIDTATMKIHHGKHHAGYVANLNRAIAGQPDLAGKGLSELLGNLKLLSNASLISAIRNNGGGHFNHSLFWESLAPEAKTSQPSDDLVAAIKAEYGSMDQMKEQFTKAAASRFGSGWAWLIVKDGKLKITSTQNQDAPVMKGVVAEADLGAPILGLDVWEHAYYLKYQNKRADYINAFWNLVNWDTVSSRHAAT